jgi:hypothetical protein
MQSIPEPHLLDPDRIIDPTRGEFVADHKARSEALEKALHESCAYAEQLWQHVDALRSYLMDSLPPDPRAPEADLRAGAAPTGPDDEVGWEHWINAYSAATSVLCGPQGDSGFGLSEARAAAQIRRSAPSSRLVAAHPYSALSVAETTAETYARKDLAVSDVVRSRGRTAAVVVLVLLAARGLLPRRER